MDDKKLIDAVVSFNGGTTETKEKFLKDLGLSYPKPSKGKMIVTLEIDLDKTKPYNEVAYSGSGGHEVSSWSDRYSWHEVLTNTKEQNHKNWIAMVTPGLTVKDVKKVKG